MIHHYILEAFSHTLVDLVGVDLSFEDKVIVCGGDFRQILHVIQKGTKAKTIGASIVKSPLWVTCKYFALNKIRDQ